MERAGKAPWTAYRNFKFRHPAWASGLGLGPPPDASTAPLGGPPRARRTRTCQCQDALARPDDKGASAIHPCTHECIQAVVWSCCP